MTFKFKGKKQFHKDFDQLSAQDQERVKKELKKMENFPLHFIESKYPFLKGRYKGIRHASPGRIRIYFTICEECRNLHHDTQYGRCENCPRENGLIVLYGVEIRRDDTYDNLNFEKSDSIEFDEKQV